MPILTILFSEYFVVCLIVLFPSVPIVEKDFSL
jgi:hypothetical protein